MLLILEHSLNKIKNILPIIGIVIVVLAFIFLLGYYEISMWQECRQTNSFMYCMRVLNK